MKHTSIGFIVLACILVAGFFFLGASKESSPYGLRSMRSGENVQSYIHDEVVTCLRTGEPGWRGRCFRDLGALLSSQFELGDVLKGLSAIDDEEGIKQQCHALVHYLGQNEYKKTQSLPQTFLNCTANGSACGEGCFHGAVEGYLSENGSTLSSSGISKICSRELVPNDVTYRACTHGLGHAFMLEFNNNIHKSLASCSHLSNLSDRENCYSGVFMENVFSFGNPDHPTKFMRPNDPTYPCTEIEDRYKDSCYSAQAAFVMQHGGFNPSLGAAFCANAPSAYRTNCFGGIGGNAVVFFSDPAAIRSACEYAPKGAARRECVNQALVFLAYQYQGEVEKVGDLCFVLDSAEQESCFRSTGDVIESWYPGKRPEKCELVDAKGTTAYRFCTGK
ncbi:hypothetical protein HY971_02125 [Candidatus Kaiserbacteria bacterium]|nr:hypothetical protein [Candidatus Kaiserbacteria bacterium]